MGRRNEAGRLLDPGESDDGWYLLEPRKPSSGLINLVREKDEVVCGRLAGAPPGSGGSAREGSLLPILPSTSVWAATNCECEVAEVLAKVDRKLLLSAELDRKLPPSTLPLVSKRPSRRPLMLPSRRSVSR